MNAKAHKDNIKKLSWKMRAAVVVSAVWLVVWFAATADSDRFEVAPFLLFGVVPVILLFGIVWIAGGYKGEKRKDVRDK